MGFFYSHGWVVCDSIPGISSADLQWYSTLQPIPAWVDAHRGLRRDHFSLVSVWKKTILPVAPIFLPGDSFVYDFVRGDGSI